MAARNNLHSILIRCSLIFSIVFGMLTLSPINPVKAATLTVTKSADTNDGVCNSDCSLREALATANPDETINFDGDYTILLSSTLVLTHDIVVDGVGHTITINGQNLYSLFRVSSGVTATLNRLIMQNGNAVDGSGGAIYNDGLSLTLTYSTLTGNQAQNGGAIYNYGQLTIDQSTFSGNSASTQGGVIFNDGGTLDITNSTFKSNSADLGGVVYNNGPFTMVSSTMTQNQVTSFGSAIADIYGFTMIGSTVSNNYKNAIYFNSSPVIRNSIIANTLFGLDCNAVNGSSTASISNTLIEDGSCSSTISGDPLLTELGDYGGYTQTIALLPGSKAINAGNNSYCTTFYDQRGAHYYGSCDLGAFESQGFTLTKESGDAQSTIINSAFANSLVVEIIGNVPTEPVNGGKITFTAPNSGASAIIDSQPVIISGGLAGVIATANGTNGTYSVSAIANSDAPGVNFTLTNLDTPNLTIANVTQDEGDTGTTTFTFTVSLSNQALDGGVSFDIATADGTATTANQDYTAKSLTNVNIPAGSSSYSFDVSVKGDAIAESDETFSVNLTNITGAVETSKSAVGTIKNDDLPPSVVTNAATNVTSGGATLNGTINAKGARTTVTFEYGTDTTYGSSINAIESPVSGATDTPVSALLTGLTPNTQYHFRAVGENSAGKTLGSDQTFTTYNLSITPEIHNGSTHTAVTWANLGDPLHAAATVTGNGPAVTGSVSFLAFRNPTCSGTGTLSGTLPIAAGGIVDPGLIVYLTEDDLSFTAHFGGDANYSAADSACVSISSSQDLTVLTLSSNSVPSDGAQLTASLSSIILQFNKNVLFGDPLNDNSADNPANYLLVEAGVNQIFDTLACGPVGEAGLKVDDTAIPVNSVQFDAATLRATLTINNTTPLPNGNYKLFICGTTSISDPTGLVFLNNEVKDSIIGFTISAPAPSSPATAQVEALPEAGFPQNRLTVLSAQPMNKRYSHDGLELEIPNLNLQESIVGVPGPDWDVSWLGSQIGYLEGTAFPTLPGNSVLTAHVWDASNAPGPFASLGSLSYGDQIIVHAWKKQYVYEVRLVNLWVSPGNTSVLSTKDEYAWLTLITCHGYDEQSGTYRWRTVVQAVLVDTN